MEIISSSKNPRFKLALALHSSKGRRQQNRIIVFGRREFTRAIEAGLRFVEVIANGEVIQEAEQSDIGQLLQQQTRPSSPSYFALSRPLFDKLNYGTRSADWIGIAERPATDLASFSIAVPSMLIVLQAIEKPGNIGAIARSVDGSGVGGLLLADPIGDVFHPNAIRASVATVFSIPIATGTSSEIRHWLSAHGYSILVATPEADRTIYETDLSGRLAILLGSESAGVSAEWRTSEIQGVKLPMRGRADSLNVSVTASLMMYEALRQRII